MSTNIKILIKPFIIYFTSANVSDSDNLTFSYSVNKKDVHINEGTTLNELNI